MKSDHFIPQRLRRHIIPKALTRLSSSFFIAHASAPYNRTGRTYELYNLTFVTRARRVLHTFASSAPNALLARPSLRRISGPLPHDSCIVTPKYGKLSTHSTSSPAIVAFGGLGR